MVRVVVVVGFSIFLSACGSGNPGPTPSGVAGRGLPKRDMSKVSASVIKAAGGVKPNSDVMRTRAILGRWRGSLPAAKVSVTFGSDGSAVIEALREDGALVAGGTGRYAWKPDGTLAGTFTGASGAISGFSSWTASFPDAATVALSGADASAKLTRSGF